MSDPIEKRLIEILRVAIEDEVKAQKRYKRGALLASNPEIKEMFNRLLAEECEHERKLTETYREIKKRLGLKIFAEDRKDVEVVSEMNQI
jgi:rubrerythrin